MESFTYCPLNQKCIKLGTVEVNRDYLSEIFQILVLIQYQLNSYKTKKSKSISY